jgi:hypothetical protein
MDLAVKDTATGNKPDTDVIDIAVHLLGGEIVFRKLLDLIDYKFDGFTIGSVNFYLIAGL